MERRDYQEELIQLVKGNNVGVPCQLCVPAGTPQLYMWSPSSCWRCNHVLNGV